MAKTIDDQANPTTHRTALTTQWLRVRAYHRSAAAVTVKDRLDPAWHLHTTPTPRGETTTLLGKHCKTNDPRSPNLYDSGMYAQQFTSAPSSTQLYASSHNVNYPPPFVGSSVNEVLSKPLDSDPSIRLLNVRPKPQCWEHGCNGRQFSTFSNLLRHQREKSGTATKSYCPKCGAEFTRTTARNGHLAHDKCTKQRQPSDDQ